jgi:hypothetical protein
MQIWNFTIAKIQKIIISSYIHMNLVNITQKFKNKLLFRIIYFYYLKLSIFFKYSKI